MYYVNFVKDEDFKKIRQSLYFVNSVPKMLTCLIWVELNICVYFVVATSSLSHQCGIYGDFPTTLQGK